MIPKKELGQHWLNDNNALEAMCDAADLQKGDVVLEIGPGTGTLTQKLVDRGAEVVALEMDTELIEYLHKKFDNHPSTSIFIEAGDIRIYDFDNMPGSYKIIANIPYYLTANLFRRLSTDATHKPTIAALLVQKEVAERVAARPGSMSFLSVVVQFFYDVSAQLVIPANLFTPPPKVDSQILRLVYHGPKYDIDTNKFFRLVKAGFGEKRKKLRSSLSGGLNITKEDADELLAKSGISADARAQELTLEDWYKIFQTWKN